MSTMIQSVLGEELEVDALDNALRKRCKRLEDRLGGIEVSPRARFTVVDNCRRHHLAVVVKVYRLTALSVSSVLLDRDNFRVVCRRRSAAGGVSKLSASVPGNFAPLGDPVALLKVVLSRARNSLDVASLALERALTESRKARVVRVDGGGDGSRGRNKGEQGGGELHVVKDVVQRWGRGATRVVVFETKGSKRGGRGCRCDIKGSSRLRRSQTLRRIR